MQTETSSLNGILDERRQFVDDYLQGIAFWRDQASPILAQSAGWNQLQKATTYSLFQTGKRFRPVLCLLFAEQFGGAPQRLAPLAAAIEMIHTYSLIHDDLPCMDNDDLRRGQPTNHKVFGEAVALLAGDALLTEAFAMLAQGYASDPQVGLDLVMLLTEAAGLRGMVGGQAIDILAKSELPKLSELEEMHAMKTGALIRLCCEGAAVAMGLVPDKVAKARRFGALLGMAFQLMDDLLDSTEDKAEKGSFPDLLGWKKTQELLNATSAQALQILRELSINEGPLQALVEYNRTRKH